MSAFTAKTTAEEAATVLKDQIIGKNVLLIGATVGSLGAEYLRAVLPHAASVIVLGRRQEAIQAAVKAASAGSEAESKVKIIQVDMTSLESVRAAAAEINGWDQPIDVILSNVQIPIYTTLNLSADRNEAQFAGNHLGPFLLIALLYPRLLQAGPGARVVQVASQTHGWVAGIRWDDVNFKLRPEEYDWLQGNGQSKLANVLMVHELARRAAKDGILAYTLHPGVIVTNGTKVLFASLPKETSIATGAALEDGSMNPAFWNNKSIEEAVATYVRASFDPSLKDKSGAYLEDCEVHNDKLGPAATQENAARLWQLSEEMVGLKFL